MPPKNNQSFPPGRVWAEVDLDAVVHNFRVTRQRLGTGRRLMLAIKADAYGFGAREVATRLAREGVDMFGVASVEEGVDLRTNGVTAIPILVLSPTPYNEIDGIFDYELTPTVSEAGFVDVLVREARARGRRVKVHVEVDTGMGRTGISDRAAPGFLRALLAHPELELEGVFSHFSAAESDTDYTREQVAAFTRLLDELTAAGIRPPLCHIANSAGFLRFDDPHFDLIRPGLMIYGILPNGIDESEIDLRPVMTLKARIVNLRDLPRGSSVSYGRRYVTPRDSRLAVLSVGYGDGYPRSLSNRGEVLIRGRRAPVVGLVCMDLTMVDVTGFDGLAVGDEAVLVGRSGDQVIATREVAGWAGTIAYEITCGISPRVPRVYFQGGVPVRMRTLLARGREL